ncbi:MAG: DUF3846 domain-containing protein [Proteobacteria bacterium]|jgi:hypothetical protein|nr:DUF3846 domain-containing protein [Pseudomonadota bacterium]
MAILYKTDGTQETILPKSGKQFTLAEMQAAVDGYIEPLYLPDGRVLLVNEDGKSRGFPYNELATFHGAMAGISMNDCVVGPALLCSHEEFADPPEEDDED